MMLNKELKREIISLSYKLKLSHIGSCISACDALVDIYEKKKPEDKVVVSCGHVHLIHALLLERYGIIKSAEQTILENGIHCDTKSGCDVSTGSLGRGIGISIGLSLVNPERQIYCLMSDGELAEGVCWEALRIATDFQIKNLHVAISCYGYGAYHKIDTNLLEDRIASFFWEYEIYHTNLDELPNFFKGQKAHYAVLDEQQYNELMTYYA